MKKAAIGLATAVLATAGAPVIAGAAAGDAKGPRCADTVGDLGGIVSSGFYDADTQTVSFRLVQAAPICRAVTYTIAIYDQSFSGTDPTAAPLVVSSTYTVSPDSPNVIFFRNLDVSGNNDATVCVVTTTSIGRNVFDRAPDTGCTELVAGEGAPARSHN